MSGDQKHQYHLVEPSPWPALGSAAGFTLFLGLTLFMHEYPYSIYVLEQVYLWFWPLCFIGGEM